MNAVIDCNIAPDKLRPILVSICSLSIGHLIFFFICTPRRVIDIPLEIKLYKSAYVFVYNVYVYITENTKKKKKNERKEEIK